MQTRVDSELREQARQYRLCFTCERCAHFAPVDAQAASAGVVPGQEPSPADACSLGYPSASHRAVDLDRAGTITFCKEFELW